MPKIRFVVNTSSRYFHVFYYITYISNTMQYAIIKKPMEIFYWVIVEGTRVLLTYGSAYKNMSPLQSSFIC